MQYTFNLVIVSIVVHAIITTNKIVLIMLDFQLTPWLIDWQIDSNKARRKLVFSRKLGVHDLQQR